MNDPRNPEESGPVTIREDGDTGDRFLVYVSKDGVRAELRVIGDTFWATQAQMAHMFGVNVRSVSQHIKNIFTEGELVADSVIQESWITAADGRTYRTNLYSLDVIIAVGYRVSSRLGTMFRIWATQVLMAYLTKGFVIDDDRLKNPDGRPDFFDELLERVRDIRSSEKRMWTRILELASFCVDYDPRDKTQHTEFFAEIQNTLHWAVVQKTASELVVERVDHQKERAGVITFKGNLPTVDEAKTAKNLLLEPEIKALNHITSLMLEFFDSQAEQRRATTLGEFQIKLRELIKLDGRPLKPWGAATSVSHAQAAAHASKEIKAFKQRKRVEAESAGEDQLRQLAKTLKDKKRSRDR
ncbi:virulence RhuM family protein [Brevundimonas sp. BAL450]|uniref:RhuM family protein n=1 Tax=Brevundimonas TaxID=41275 RepID=UPI0018CBB94C|nr:MULTISPECIES: RhuM family protein [Brevundimonas]MBG7615426.1 virulence RhuM family protein [Brevundimonas sp. BAL450]